LKNGGTLEKTASMTNHASTALSSSMTGAPMRVTLGEVERMGI